LAEIGEVSRGWAYNSIGSVESAADFGRKLWLKVDRCKLVQHQPRSSDEPYLNDGQRPVTDEAD